MFVDQCNQSLCRNKNERLMINMFLKNKKVQGSNFRTLCAHWKINKNN